MPSLPARSSASALPPSLQWDVFCRVVDNFGDVGVCWRLARDLARRGQRVRLWVDDASALRWMAPAGEPGVEVVPWLASTPLPAPGDVVIEAFGCDPPEAFVAAMAARAAQAIAPPCVWINLEYLSAEAYVERSHGLASPRQAEPGRGLVKWFFYPGFTAATGGLLREPGLEAAREAFDRDAWLAAQGLARAPGERLVSVFCYPGAPVDRLVAALAADGVPTLILTAPGAATGATRAALVAVELRPESAGAPLRQHALPWLSQDDYDRLLWSCDLNVVRGEDSWVRAQWAGRAFVWQAYVQEDGAHVAKVQAFLDRMLAHAGPDAAAQLRRWHAAWNGFEARTEAGAGTPAAPAAAAAGTGAAPATPEPAPLPPWTPAALQAAATAVQAWRAQLLAQPDLVTALLAKVLETS
jgi:uncharacterized repeat protein (TIGR03837 family)